MSATTLPLVPAFAPSLTDSWPRKIAVVLAGSAALALASQPEIQVGPVPITLQTAVVLLIGFAFGSRLGAATMLAYLAEGAMGLPVFSGGAAGAQELVGPTAGYLWAFPVAAGLTGFLSERGWSKRWWTVAAGMVLGNLVIYGMGAPWLAHLTDTTTAWNFGVKPFIIGDLLKIGVAVAALPLLSRRAYDA